MRTRYYLAIITVLAVMVVFLSYMALGYANFLYVMPSPEENSTHSYRLLICEAQQQLGYEMCEVDGLVIDFGDVDARNQYFTSLPPAGDPETIYDPDSTEWWGELIESLGSESKTVWTEPGWGDEMWVEIKNLGNGAYLVSLHGIAASGDPIVYSITETDRGFYTYGPMLEDGTMNSRSYVDAP